MQERERISRSVSPGVGDVDSGDKRGGDRDEEWRGGRDG